MKKKIQQKIKPAIALLLVLSIVFLTGINRDMLLNADGSYPIMGSSNVVKGQLINYYLEHAEYPSDYIKWNSDAQNIDVFCQIYMEECAAEGVRVEVAFCQAMKETNWLKYTGRVPRSSYNFAGIGAIDSNVSAYATFSSVREGVRAQIQHLKAYASKEALNNPCVDPRFTYVKRESAIYVEELTGKWATSSTYGQDIRKMMTSLVGTTQFSTWYEGVDYAAVYNPIYYLSHNTDLQLFNNNGEGLIAHFVNHGMAEGRQGCELFNVYSYKNLYADLRGGFQDNLKAYYLHYVTNGKAEGRIATGYENTRVGFVTRYNGIDYSSVYNYNYYIAHYSDMKKAYDDDDIGALAHFVNHGMSEGRQGSDQFDVMSYKMANADLRHAYRNDNKAYYLHYVNYGQKEGRIATGCSTIQGATTIYNGVDYAAVYSYEEYVNRYPDMKKAFATDDEGALAHFVNHGMNEGRVGKNSFNPYSYRNEYADLRHAYGNCMKLYYLHYMNYGMREGRNGTGCMSLMHATTVYNGVDYSAIYDYNEYINRYEDIKRAYGGDENAVIKHFVEHGMDEGRIGKNTFIWNVYRDRYQDLAQGFGNDIKAYYIHYLYHGQKEGRIAY